MKGFIRKKSICSFAFILLYKILLDFIYVNFVYKVFAYSGFIYEPNTTKYLIGMGYLIMMFLFLPKDSAKPSSIFLQLHYIIMIIPIITLFGLANESHDFMLYITVLFIMQCFIMKSISNIKVIRLKNSNKVLYALIAMISLMVYVSMIRVNGLPSLKALNILNVYEVRKEVVTPFLMGYMVNWQAKIINPFLITIGYLKKNRKVLLIGIILQLLIFLITAHRSFLFIPAGIIIVVKIFEIRTNVLMTSSVVANLGVGITYLSYALTGEILIPSVFIRRFLFVPAKIKFNYYDFFSNNKFIYFSQGLIGKLFGFEYPYDIPRNYFMSYLYGGSITSAANTGYLADAYSQMGFFGMFILSLLFIFILVIIDSLGRRIDNRLVIGLTLFTMISLNDVALLTAMLTGGLFLLLIILYLYNESEVTSVWGSNSTDLHKILEVYMLRNAIYRISYYFINKNMFRYFNQFENNRGKSIIILENEENEALYNLMKHAFNNIPYYKDIAANLNLSAEDFKTKKDLSKLPVLTKDIIKSRYKDFIWDKETDYKLGRTGGSTGAPLSYRMSKSCYYRGTAQSLVRYSKAGYKPGDLMVNFGGGSIVGKTRIKTKIREFLLNNKSFSSYGFTEDTLEQIYVLLQDKKKVYIHGYASSIYILAMYLLKNRKVISGQGGVFCTSEQLFDFQRIEIKKAFPNCHVYDAYGLNDGGITACDCNEHNGMHIEYGRSLVEVVDEFGNQIEDTPGRVLATSLYNYSFPFIRYDTGDVSKITYEKCSCGMDTPRLLELEGRKTDFLELDGKKIGSPVLTVLMGLIPEVELYRVVQKKSKIIIFKLCIEDKSKKDKQTIEKIQMLIIKSITEKLPNAIIAFEYYDSPITLMSGHNKHRIIVNENN